MGKLNSIYSGVELGRREGFVLSPCAVKCESVSDDCIMLEVQSFSFVGVIVINWERRINDCVLWVYCVWNCIMKIGTLIESLTKVWNRSIFCSLESRISQTGMGAPTLEGGQPVVCLNFPHKSYENGTRYCGSRCPRSKIFHIGWGFRRGCGSEICCQVQKWQSHHFGGGGGGGGRGRFILPTKTMSPSPTNQMQKNQSWMGLQLIVYIFQNNAPPSCFSRCSGIKRNGPRWYSLIKSTNVFTHTMYSNTGQKTIPFVVTEIAADNWYQTPSFQVKDTSSYGLYLIQRFLDFVSLIHWSPCTIRKISFTGQSMCLSPSTFHPGEKKEWIITVRWQWLWRAAGFRHKLLAIYSCRFWISYSTKSITNKPDQVTLIIRKI